MLFTQGEFLFIFLPITFAGYFLIARYVEAPAARLSWLAAASLAFYSYWDFRFLPIILISIVFNYVMGLLIAPRKGSKARGWLFAAAVTANLLALGFFKYTNFAIQIFDAITPSQYPSLAIVLPLGISFFTFTQIAYLADVYGGYPHERSFVKYGLFVTYFPHLDRRSHPSSPRDDAAIRFEGKPDHFGRKTSRSALPSSPSAFSRSRSSPTALR